MNYYPQRLSISWIRQCYKNGELTPEELFHEIVKRSEKYKEYNVWIKKPDYKDMEKYIDNLKNINIDDAPLWGIPFAIKDNIDQKGVETTAACAEYGYIPREDATVVKRLIKAGAIPVGKTNLDQFATGLVGTRSPYGEVHNSIDRELISGGSSSGSAVAVALGMAAFALGTDTAGSGRVPAALNNLIGYKPPVGSWSSKGVVPACASLDCVTVFTDELKDSLLVNELVRGFDENCIWSKNFGEINVRMPLRILIPKDEPVFYGDYKEEYRKNWDRAVDRIKDLGVEVSYIDCTMFSKAASILYDGPWVAERWKDLGPFVTSHPGATFPVTERILQSGGNPKNTAVSMFEAMHKLQEYRHITEEILKDAVLIMPTAGGTFTREQVRNNPIETNSQMGLYTNHCNLLDLCAINIPVNSQEQLMPFGITLFALSDSEGLIQETASRLLSEEKVVLAVCGLHKKGMMLENQLTSLGATYEGRTKTSDNYRLFILDTVPVKPGLIRADNGNNIEVDLYKIPVRNLGKFMAEVKSPLAIGDIELIDKRVVKGFICEEYATRNAIDITDKGTFY